MKPASFSCTSTSLMTLCLLGIASVAAAQVPDVITETGFISGTMKIDFGTRSNLDTTGSFTEGSPARNAQDVYEVNLNVAKTTEYTGKIIRKPRLIGKLIGREVQPASLAYGMDVAVRNPKDLSQKKVVGKWVGTVSINDQGVYDFGSGQQGASQLRIAVDAVGKAPAFVGNFSGRVYGKGQAQKGVVAEKISEYTRMVKGRKVTVQAKKTDPLRFVDLVLGEGPAQVYPRAVVNGNLDYDYETGNWYTNGIKFKYTLNGVEYEDSLTGSIKWVEDPHRSSNGKGQYEFNLRFNEAALKAPADESAVFAAPTSSDEAAFFEVDNSVPSLTGTISYVDTLDRGADEEEPTVLKSEVTYNLNANKLTKQQAVNLFKLWMVIVGPTNDE